MKILVVTNIFPPYFVGGYELGCKDVVEKLRGRGHDVRVLTSDFMLDGAAPVEADVERVLHYFAPGERAATFRECRKLARSLRNFRPDVVYFWLQAGLDRWLSIAARLLGYRVAFFISDPGYSTLRVAAVLRRWAPPGSQTPVARLIRAVFGRTFLVLGWPVMQDQTCHLTSRFLKNLIASTGIRFKPETSMVAYCGINVAPFAGPPAAGSRPVRRLLYVGQLVPHKGAHTAIRAFGLVALETGFEDLTLTIVGGGAEAEYERMLRGLPAQLGVSGRVRFLGKLPRADLPAVYREHDVLVFPSEWDEPFALTPLEATAAGLAVVGTTTGGSGEFLRNRDTAMTYKAGDAADCARALRELCADLDLATAIRANAYREIVSLYTVDTEVDAIEKSLETLKNLKH